MKVSSDFTDHMEQLERRMSKAYNDGYGFLTIGIGHKLTQSEMSSGKIIINGAPVKWSQGLADDQIYHLFWQDVLPASFAVEELLPGVDLTQNQFDALVSFVFNIGRGAFRTSTLRKKLLAGKFEEVPEQMRRWKYSAGRISQGLINRREKEIKLWLGEE